MSTPGDEDGYAKNAEFWVKIIRQQLDPYRTELTDSAVTDAVGACAGLTMLDGGCGEGYLSRHFFSQGARTSGIDVSRSLITAAEQERDRQGLDIGYRVASLEDMPYANKSFDIVVSNHVIPDVENPEAALGEIGRVTKPGGKLVILMLHPCFYTGRAERETTDTLSADTYFSTRRVHQTFNVAGIESPDEIHLTLRPLEYYAALLADSGFVITRLAEPHPSPEQLRHGWWSTHFVKPTFILLVGERRQS